MSYYNSTEDDRERERERQREYESEVIYQVWRRGGNPDAVQPDEVSDAYYNGIPEDRLSNRIVRRQRSHYEES